MFKDGRGVEARKAKLKIRADNVKRVAGWLDKHDDGTPTQCAKDLGLSRPTIYSIAKELKALRDAKV